MYWLWFGIVHNGIFMKGFQRLSIVWNESFSVPFSLNLVAKRFRIQIMVVIKVDTKKCYEKNNIFQKLCCRKNAKSDTILIDKKQSKIVKLFSYVKNNIFKEIFDDVIYFFDTTSVHGLRHVVAHGVHPIERFVFNNSLNKH